MDRTKEFEPIESAGGEGGGGREENGREEMHGR